MTLTVETTALAAATTTAATSPMSSGHPSLGRAPQATIIPVSLTCYQILLGDEAKGYVCSVKDGWECFAGAHMADARSIGVRKSLTTAMRDLVTDTRAAVMNDAATEKGRLAEAA